MPKVRVITGETFKEVRVEAGSLAGDAILQAGLSLDQPCAGRGTCGKCKVIEEFGLSDPDPLETSHLDPVELSLKTRLACRARVIRDASIILPAVEMATDKAFHLSERYRQDEKVPLGIAVDLGSTVVAAFLTTLDDGKPCRAAATLNQQVIFGADVISRLAAVQKDPANAARLQNLALASIRQAAQKLKLPSNIWNRINRAVIVSNPAMHHLLLHLPVETLAVLPFEPYSTEPLTDAGTRLGGIFPPWVEVWFPPLIGGFVGSDALACLSFFLFDLAPAPQLAVDLGTNGEVMLTDGRRILTTSTAAGPAFEGGNISCGVRAISGAIYDLRIGSDGTPITETITNAEPVGITGSGLIKAIRIFRSAGAIEPSGRINHTSPLARCLNSGATREQWILPLKTDGRLYLSQGDIRELQKAKGAIRAAISLLLEDLSLQPSDLRRVILTGSFGGRIDVPSALQLGLLPPVNADIVESIPNGAGFGAAGFLREGGFERATSLVGRAEYIELNLNPGFMNAFSDFLRLVP